MCKVIRGIPLRGCTGLILSPPVLRSLQPGKNLAVLTFMRRHSATVPVFKAGLVGSNSENVGNDVATRCILMALNESKCVCGRPGPRWESLQRSPNSLAELGDWGREEGKGREGRDGRDGEGRKGKGRSTPPSSKNSGYGLASSH